MTRAALLILFGAVIGAAGTVAIRTVETGESTTEETNLNAPSSYACGSADSEQLSTLTSDIDFGDEGSIETAPIADEPTSPSLNPNSSSKPTSSPNGKESASNSANQQSADLTNLPEKFKYLVEPQPVAKRRLTPQENHEFFSQDTRDESWAYTMELGIREYLAANQNANGTVVEYVECRSRMCEIAGVVYPGGQDDFSEHLEVMRQSGWWQLSNSHHSSGANVDGEYRFVSFIPREDEDTLIAEIASSMCD